MPTLLFAADTMHRWNDTAQTKAHDWVTHSTTGRLPMRGEKLKDVLPHFDSLARFILLSQMLIGSMLLFLFLCIVLSIKRLSFFAV